MASQHDLFDATAAAGEGKDGEAKMDGDNGIANYQAIIMIAENQQSISVVNGEASIKDNISVDNPYGPWMLVKRPIRRKENIRSNTNNNNVVHGGTGKHAANQGIKSRFAALEDKREDEEVNKEADIEEIVKENQSTITKVTYPNQETIEFVKQKAEIFKRHFAMTEPPDPGVFNHMEVCVEQNIAVASSSIIVVGTVQEMAVDNNSGNGSLNPPSYQL
ncbi:hypothetical protein RIF29_34387 [Crotalaria pallida]|uniref:Uncharacterized protein n=1 Tax=Crotalaria pallida TaxID=3830 RepID=A0AAN9EES1_CROPI